MTKGFSLIEILVALAIMLTLAAGSFWYFGKMAPQEALIKDREGVISLLEQARSFSLSSKNSTSYGVHLGSSGAVLFPGDTYTEGNPQNVEYELNPYVQISNINLYNGSTDVVFSRLNGKIENFGYVELSLISEPGNTMTITILETGMIQ